MSVELSEIDQVRVKMLSAALSASGIVGVIKAQVEQAVKEGKVSIGEATNHRSVLLNQAAQTMGAGIAAALSVLNEEGYAIVRSDIEEEQQGSTSVPSIDGGGNPPVEAGDAIDDEAILGAPV